VGDDEEDTMTLPDSLDGWLAPTGVVGSIYFAIRWWYSTRKLKNAATVDTSAAQSAAWMFEYLKGEIERLNTEVKALRNENAAQTQEILRLTSLMKRI
jgi:hypothetical protein